MFNNQFSSLKDIEALKQQISDEQIKKDLEKLENKLKSAKEKRDEYKFQTAEGIVGLVQKEIEKYEQQLETKLVDLRNPYFDNFLQETVVKAREKNQIHIDEKNFEQTISYFDIQLANNLYWTKDESVDNLLFTMLFFHFSHEPYRLTRNQKVQKTKGRNKKQVIDTALSYKNYVMFLTKSSTSSLLDKAIMQNLVLMKQYCEYKRKIRVYGIAFDLFNLVFTCHDSNENQSLISQPYQIYDWDSREIKVDNIRKVIEIIQAVSQK